MDYFSPGLGDLAIVLCKTELGVATVQKSASGYAHYTLDDQDDPPVPIAVQLSLHLRKENKSSSSSKVAAALRPLLWLGTSGGVALPNQPGSNDLPTQADVVAARRGYQDGLLRVLRGGRAGFGAPQYALVSAAAVCELLAAHFCSPCSTTTAVPPPSSCGIAAALHIYDQILTSLLPCPGGKEGEPLSEAPGDCPWHVEALALERCAVAVDAAIHAVHAVSPKHARSLLHTTLAFYPSHPTLLRLLTRLEMHGHSVGALRRELNVHVAEHPEQSCPAWVTLFGVEVGTTAPRSAVRGILERAVSTSAGRSCPLLWRLYLRYVFQLEGTPGSVRAEFLHKIFLRAIEACPWAKVLWMDGMRLLNGSTRPEELSEFLTVMK